MPFNPLSFLKPNVEGAPSGEAVCCSKSCYNHLLKGLENINQGKEPAGDGKHILWEKDGKNGNSDPVNSMSILLDWWTDGENYAKYRGSKNGIKKTTIANILAKKMNDVGVRVTRDALNIMNKISHLEQQFRKAHDWAHGQTGAGLRETDEGSFKDAVKGKCKYYFDLEPIMRNCASAKAMLTSDDIKDDDTLSVSSTEKNELDSSDDDSVAVVEDSATLSASKSVESKMSAQKTCKKKDPKKNKKSGKFNFGINSSVKHLQKIKLKDIEEKKCHNFEMENIEAKCQKSEHEATKWKRKQDELTYMSSLVDQYDSLKGKRWNKEKILKIFPSMAPLVEADNSSDSE
jgi:hypothetical protein